MLQLNEGESFFQEKIVILLFAMLSFLIAPSGWAQISLTSVDLSSASHSRHDTEGCTDHVETIKAWAQEILHTDIFDIKWNEDHPKIGGSGKFVLHNYHGKLRVDMRNSDDESQGITPTKVCRNGRKLTAELDLSKLSFGLIGGGVVHSDIARYQPKDKQNVLLLDITAASGNRIHIGDRFRGSSPYDGGHLIDSTFSPLATR